MTIAIDFQNVKKHYKLYPSHMSMALDWAGYYKMRFWQTPPAFPVKQALHDVTVQIRRGDRVGIIGRNGAGKTTLLKLAAGMVSPTAGKIRVQGQVQVLMKLGAAFHPDFSGSENIRHSLLYNGVRGKDLEKAYDAVVDFVELGDFLDQPMRAYSMGMATRLQFAVATAITPDILIIDEVLGAGDAYFAAKSADRMRSLTKSGCTLLLVSHARAQIMEFCTSALWLDHGKVRMQGHLADVTTAYDKAIAEAIGGQEEKQTVTSGYLPLPAHLRHPDYLRHIKEKVEMLGTTLEWKETNLSGAQIAGENPDYRGVVIKKVEIFVSGSPSNYMTTGHEFFIRVGIKSGVGALSCEIMFFANGGDLIAATESQASIANPGDMLSVSFGQMPLGHRDYLMAVILKQNGKVVSVLAGIYMKVMETNDSDPPYLLYPADWYVGKKEIFSRSRIAGAI